jgi:hypothetical protein
MHGRDRERYLGGQKLMSVKNREHWKKEKKIPGN